MTIQKVSLNSHFAKSNIKFVKNYTASNSIIETKKVDTKDILYHYPVNFGSLNSVKTQPIQISFEDSLQKYFRFAPDKYQIESAKHIYNNADTLVLAPTGTGKTLIAEYAINKNLDEGKTTYYTTPLKALSNEKYTDFCKLYGKENVGLLTGDIKINPQAPVVIMTTEIYRNMLLGEKQSDLINRLQDVATVVYDEFHYMNDSDRGEVWETSIMYTPDNVQQLLLSATAENGDVVKKWIDRLLVEKTSQRSAEIVNVPSDERHVPLKYYIYNPAKSKFSIIPLIDEKFSLKKLAKMSNPESKIQLSDKQKDILSEISTRKDGDGSVKNGIETLYQIVEPNGNLALLEKALVKKLKYAPIEAQRVASILSNKAESSLNPSLKVNPLQKKDDQKAYFANKAPQKFISEQKAKRLLINPDLNRDARRAYKFLSQAMGGTFTSEDGYKKVNQLIGNADIGVGEFKKKLLSIGLKADYVNSIVDSLVYLKRPEFAPQEFDLIEVLNKEDKLPAIFFNFSKKQCNNLRDKYLKTGNSLLTKEEKELASEIIKKHVEKGGFFGTNENPASLLSGVALHHAGKMPAYKALVEELAQKKLLKVVFATSTLGAGINVPAKTVVFTQLTRYAGQHGGQNGERFVTLSPSEFAQMAGRAGRRGKDFIGNVIVIPDREHGANCIYNLATSKPDAINSNFKPTYSFISHFISQNGTDKTLVDSVDKSFLKESLESKGVKPYKIMNSVKKQFQAMARVLTKPELECFEYVDGVYRPTVKGDVVSKARGVDGILFAETLFNSGLQYLTPQELATVACALTSGDERDAEIPVSFVDSVSDTFWAIEKLNEKIELAQIEEKVDFDELRLNKPEAQYIYEWASADGVDSRLDWENLIKRNASQTPTFNEGDFLKSVNRTIDILEQIKEISKYVIDSYSGNDEKANIVERMRAINNNATEALKLLKRDPVEFEL